MAKAILICGPICAGKTTYAKKLASETNAVILSVDEVMLTIFGQHCGDMHDEYAARTQKYLYSKSLELINSGIDVILDWGFWTHDGRREATAFYRSRGIECEMHCLDVDTDVLSEHIKKRNAEVEQGSTLAYYVDENLVRKFEALYEEPGADEADVNIYVCVE